MKPGQGRIVVGVDGSAASVAALRWAETEAIARQAELDAVYAWDEALQLRAPYAGWTGTPDPEQDRAAAAAVLASSVRMALGPYPAVPLKSAGAWQHRPAWPSGRGQSDPPDMPAQGRVPGAHR